ncbi:MAG: hypothetical protein H8E55_08380 [Pelagibacterales bacterium]|nr:hypothetical protein [Pelagibacterales bacterium]
MATKIKWEGADFKWDLAPTDTNATRYTWDDVTLVEDLISGGGSGEELAWNINQLDPVKKRRFIRLICKVKGIETYSGQKTIKENIKITANDVQLVAKEVLGIDLTVENIHV